MASVREFSPFAHDPLPPALGARTSHPRPSFKLNDHSQVRPGLPACVARSCVIGTLPANDRVAMVTVPSELGVLMADDANGRGLTVPPMPEAAQRRMLELAPFAAARNPIDATGQFLNDPSLLGQAIELAATNGNYGSLVNFQGSIGRNPALMEATRASWIERKRVTPDKHLTVSRFCTADYTRDLEAVGISVYEEATHATRAIAALAGFARSFRERRARPDVPAPASLPTGPVNELAALNVVAAAGVPTVPARHARTARAAADAAADLGFLVVLKVLSADILHKSDIGGVRLGVADRAAAEISFDEILAAARATQPDAAIDGCLVAPMVTGGVETILGVQRDPVFGPIVMFGLGGIFVEALNDVTFRAPLRRSRGAGHDRVGRRLPAPDGPSWPAPRRPIRPRDCPLPPLSLRRRQRPHHREPRHQPVLVRPDGALALDALLVVRPPPHDGTCAPDARVCPKPCRRLPSSAYNRPGDPGRSRQCSPRSASTTGPDNCALALESRRL